MKTFNRKLSISLFVAMLIVMVFLLAARFEYDRQIESEKREIATRINVLSAQLEGRISSYIFYGNSMKAFIQSRNILDERELTSYLSHLIDSSDTTFRNFTVLKDTTIIYVYPKKGNESALGRDLGKIEGQKETVLSVKASGKILVTGPVKLVQGGQGIVMRIPVHIKDKTGKEVYWGQISEVLRYEELTKIVSMYRYFETLNMKIYETNTAERVQHTVWSNTDKMLEDPVKGVIHLSQSSWNVEAEPKKGWVGATPVFYVLILLGMVSAACGGMYMYLLLRSKEELQVLVGKKTHELEASLDELKETQTQLIASEKLASLGELVAGVAHEINTPLGIALTLNTFVETKHQELAKLFEENHLTNKIMAEYVASVSEANELAVRNLHRVSDIVVDFKQVAVDQASQDVRKINLGSYVQSVVGNLMPKIRRTSHRIDLDCDMNLELVSYPGAIAQIVTNLVMNSLIHGFENVENGIMRLEVKRVGEWVHLEYRDNGLGIPEEAHEKVFHPFYTTRKNLGSTGLGMHIVHNLVTQVLRGKISLESEQGKGVCFKVEFPIRSVLDHLKEVHGEDED